jgi:hypothetical protein
MVSAQRNPKPEAQGDVDLAMKRLKEFARGCDSRLTAATDERQDGITARR